MQKIIYLKRFPGAIWSLNWVLRDRLVFNFFVFFFITSGALGQRRPPEGTFTAAYFDSIRIQVYDTLKEHYTINAYRLADTDEIHIDGKLDEQAWKMAEHKGEFLEKEPYPLVPVSEKTEFAILYDDKNLYIGVWCWDNEPGKIIRQLTPRGISAPDHLMLFIDSYHDHRTGYKFVVSPTGVQGDELRYDDVKRDGNWNGIWYSEGSVDEKGWYAEAKIPFYNFRYPRKDEHTWGFNIMRSISKDASRGQWKPHLPEWDNTTRMSQLGHIENLKNISSGRTFEVRPYAVASSMGTAGADSRNTISLGGDVRFSPSPNLTADFTFNPDFAQVDADVFEINLTRFPTRFKELRPFFTEQINIFNTPLELFYSRRIGAKGDILGGAKVTGKLHHGLEFGMLGNITGESLFSSSSQNREDARFGVFRIKKDVFGSSNIGFLAATKEQHSQYNRVFGIDGSFMLSRHGILDVQIASGQTESQSGQHMAYNMTYLRTGDLFGYKFNFDRVEPLFEINRVGYLKKEPDRGWNKGAGSLKISPRINKYNVRRVTVNLNVELNRDLINSGYTDRWLKLYPTFTPDTVFGKVTESNTGVRKIEGGRRYADNHLAGGDLTINMINEMSLLSEYSMFTATELTGSYSGNFFRVNYLTRPLSLGSRAAGVFSYAAGTLYNFEKKYPGRHNSFSLNGEGRLWHNVSTSLQGAFTKTFDDHMKRDGYYYNLSSNSTWMFTKAFFIRLHMQGIFGTTFYEQRQTKNEYLLSGLLSWEYRPGSFLYLAYNESRLDDISPDFSREMELRNRTLIFKLSYFFSI